MSKPERGSLTSLLTKKPLGQGAPAAVPLEEAESTLLGGERAVRGPTADGRTAEELAGRTDVETDDHPTRLLGRSRRRTVRVPWTFKLPMELREELEAVARFNDLNMTEIACEAIERHLKHFPHPPERKGRGGER